MGKDVEELLLSSKDHAKKKILFRAESMEDAGNITLLTHFPIH